MLRGRCACNAAGYEVADEFVVPYNCHCSNCRAMTGSAFLPWGEIEPEKLRVKIGTDSLLVDGDAGAAHAMRCGQCLSLLYWTVHHHHRTWLRVPYGTPTDEPTLKPTAHMFVGSKAVPAPITDRRPAPRIRWDRLSRTPPVQVRASLFSRRARLLATAFAGATGAVASALREQEVRVVVRTVPIEVRGGCVLANADQNIRVAR